MRAERLEGHAPPGGESNRDGEVDRLDCGSEASGSTLFGRAAASDCLFWRNPGCASLFSGASFLTRRPRSGRQVGHPPNPRTMIHSRFARFLPALAASALLAEVPMAQGGPPPPPPPPPPPVAQAPLGNPVTLAKTNLGKALFYEEQMGSDRTMACGTCHIVSAGGSDPRTSQPASGSVHPGFNSAFGDPDDVFGSRGVSRAQADGRFDLAPIFRLQRQVTTRRAPSAINAAFAPRQFWDGRAEGPFSDPVGGGVVLRAGASLEIQALGPPTSDVEMGHLGRNWNDVVARVNAVVPLRLASNVPPALSTWINGRMYPDLFQEAFGSPGVTAVRIVEAI